MRRSVHNDHLVSYAAMSATLIFAAGQMSDKTYGQRASAIIGTMDIVFDEVDR